MKKSLSLLLTFALVISLFANMASAAETPASAGKYLQEAGIIKGTATGDLLSGSTWKRQDLAVLLSRLLNVEKEAQATKKSHTYKDVTGTFYDGYLSWAKEKNYLEGSSATKFGFNGTLSNQEFAAVVLRALGVETTGDKYASVPELAVKAGILPEGTDWKAAAKRGDTYVALVAALHTEVAGSGGKTLGQILNLKGFEVTAATAISSVTATAAKKLTVAFNGTVDTAKAKITVLNGANTVNSKSVTFSEDKKSAVIEFALNLPAAEYTVKVEGITDAALTGTVKVEAEKVTKITFNNEKAALDRGNNQIVTVGYKVFNQYNEEINGTPLSATAGKGSAVAANGTVTISATTPFTLGEKVVVSLVHTGSAFATVTAEVSSAAQVASVKIVKLYNANGKELVAGSSEEFRLVLELKDQYGASVNSLTYLNGNSAATPPVLSDLIVSVSNPSKADLVGYVASSNTALYSIAPVDGTNQVVLTLKNSTLLNAGTSNVTIISKSTGAKDSFDIVVKENVKIDTLTLTAPASAPAGSKINIPYTAVDQFGAAIKHPNNDMLATGSALNGVSFVKDIVKDVTNLEYTLPATKGVVIITLITHTNKVAQVTINVTDGKVASLISGTKDLDTALLKDGGTATITKDNIKVKDQYGNDFSSFNWGTAPGQYRAVVQSSGSAVSLAKTNATEFIVDGTDTVTLNAAAKGTASVTLTLQINDGGWKDVANSAYNFSEKVVEKADIKSYTPTVSGTVYQSIDAKYEKALTVKGSLEDGSTVTIPNNSENYTIKSTTTGVEFNAGKVKVTPAFNGFGDKSEVEVSLLVLIRGAASETQQVTVKVSKSLPSATTVSLKDSGGNGTKEADGVVSASVANVNTVAGVVALVRGIVKVEDQYGVELDNATVISAANIDISNISKGHLIPAGAAGTALAAEDTFTVTVVTTNGKWHQFKVIVKA
ncbi:hypothetical protein [Cohnella abietis]|nr:hypothetical protein [Cohnella abietis]